MEHNPSTIYYTTAGLILILMVLGYLLLGIFLWGNDRKDIKRCTDFKTQKDAQNVYNSNPISYANLDKNNDGLACSALPRQ